ncbi:RHS repeat-associated core domain-containing protein [Pseudomonas syringae]|uniref:RHS repeat-associated core domain-containing protein n=1 Tax=Pseudomonas syringae TaxID=317 RepID=UPI003F857E48
MAASTSVHSNALNFMSCLKSGVDPRTGLYNVSIALPELQSNDLRGPGFNLDLSYSQLNSIDSGYGLGWNLQLSQYNPGTHILSLSTGETFCIDGTREVSCLDGTRRTELTMSEKKLDTFHFYELDATHYRVAHKSGLVEILEVHYSGNNKMAWPVQIIAASGHGIRLKHSPFNSTRFMLDSITDDLGDALLQITRSGTSINLAMHPSAGPEGKPLALFVMKLSTSDKIVSSIVLPTGDNPETNASWRFEYQLKEGNQRCIKSVDTPSGSHEDIFYLDAGHPFPSGANRVRIPRVTRHIVNPGLEQATIDVRYTYLDGQQRQRNFLGAGLSIKWDDDGLDNLYKYLQDYDYVCTESLWVDEKPVRSIERTFNRFHLQTREVTAQNGHQKTVTTAYNYIAGVHYAEQPADCQLPRETVTSWQLLNEPARTRSETVTDTYDNQGNVLVHLRADGIEEISSWYPAGASDGCPADAEGFVCRLREKIIKPAASMQAGATTLSTRYRYASIGTLTGSEASYWIVPESETLVQIDGDTEVELQQIRIELIDNPADPFAHGRTVRHTQTLNGNSTFTRYAYSKFNEWQPGGTMLSISQTTETNFDAAQKTVEHQLSALTGHKLLIEEDGVETRYVYDALNRLTLETVAAGTPYQASRKFEYTLCNAPGQQAEQTLTHASGVRTRSLMDGLGRTVSEEKDRIEGPKSQVMKPIHTARYNAWNQLEQETAHDWLGAKPLASSTLGYRYDDWNQRCCTTTDDNVQTYEYSDPIGSGVHKGPIQKTWKQSGDPEGRISGRSETWLNLFGKPDRIRTLTAGKTGRSRTHSMSRSRNLTTTEQELSRQTFLYDGLGRCTEQRDALQQSTLFSYDNWSRMVSSTLADGSVINRSYAPQSSSELATMLEVVHQNGTTRTVAGTQKFDGLERVTQTKTGDRVEQFNYDAGEMQPRSRTTAGLDNINFTYTRALTDQIFSSTAPDETAKFDYDKTSARLIEATNPQGKRTYRYDVHNQLTGETWDNLLGQAWETRHQSSLLGRPIKRTDLKKGEAAGAETSYDYDTLGRIRFINQSNLRTTIDYDVLGQLCKVATEDLQAGTGVIIDMEYDDQGQEILRTQTASNQAALTLTQTWAVDGLLKTRDLQQAGSSLLHETFSYDPRGRLTLVNYLGSSLPRDELQREMTRQIFTFDELDNITLCQTRFTDGTSERAAFKYGSPGDDKHKDRCQLLSIAYTPPRKTPDPTFSYDANGNQLEDEHGNSLHYDSQSRLLQVAETGGAPISQYRYDGHNQLVATRDGNESEILRLYEGHQLSSTVQEDQRTQYLHLGEQPLGQQIVDDAEQTLLLLTDANQSVMGEFQQGQLRKAVYSAYGERHSEEALLSTAGFNGEVREAANGWYLLGNGYRAYNPLLMRFHSPDFLSPFAEGGVNPYTYCLGNPIALRDPTGHDASGQTGRLRRPDEGALPMQQGGGDIMGWVGVGIGVVFTVLGVAATIATLGTATPVTGPVTVLGISMTASAAAAVSTVSTGALIVGTALTAASTTANTVAIVNNDQTAGEVAGWLGIAAVPVGLVGFGAGAVVARAVAAAAKVAATAGSRAGSVSGSLRSISSVGSARSVAGGSRAGSVGGSLRSISSVGSARSVAGGSMAGVAQSSSGNLAPVVASSTATTAARGNWIVTTLNRLGPEFGPTVTRVRNLAPIENPGPELIGLMRIIRA